MRKSAPYNDNISAGGVGVMSMDYLGGFHYQGTALKFFPTVEGYVQATSLKIGFAYSYVYNYTDHLGNIRLSYAMDPETNVLTILDENHYYPFGLKHTNYNSDQLAFKEKDPGPGLMLMAAGVDPVPQFVYNYKYNGKELQDEMGMNWYDYGARNYDPAIGRWMNIDPLAEQGRRWSPYAYAMDNPVYFIDPDGMWPWPSWSDVKKFASGFGNTAWGMVKSAATPGVGGTRSIVKMGTKFAKGDTKEALNIAKEASGIPAVTKTVKAAVNGDPEAIGSLTAVVVAVVATKKTGVKPVAAVEASTVEMSTLNSAVRTTAAEMKAAG